MFSRYYNFVGLIISTFILGNAYVLLTSTDDVRAILQKHLILCVVNAVFSYIFQFALHSIAPTCIV